MRNIIFFMFCLLIGLISFGLIYIDLVGPYWVVWGSKKVLCARSVLRKEEKRDIFFIILDLFRYIYIICLNIIYIFFLVKGFCSDIFGLCYRLVIISSNSINHPARPSTI